MLPVARSAPPRQSPPPHPSPPTRPARPRLDRAPPPTMLPDAALRLNETQCDSLHCAVIRCTALRFIEGTTTWRPVGVGKLMRVGTGQPGMLPATRSELVV